MMHRFVFFLCLCSWMGCSTRSGDRLEYELGRRTQVMDEDTWLELEGGTFITVQTTVTQTNERQVTQYLVRAESLAPSIRINTFDCKPKVFHFEVVNTQAERCTYEAFRLGEHAVDEGTRRLLDGLVSVPIPGRKTPGTYLVRSSECNVDVGEQDQVRLSACIDWSTGRSKVLPGFVEYEACFPDVTHGTCVEDLNGVETAVSSQAIETVITLSQAAAQDIVVAALSNLSSNPGDLAALGESLRSHGVDFLIIVGDITSDGTLAEAERVKSLLDIHLSVPWFVTLGDKDVGGNLGLEYLRLFGSASLAFEVLGIRFVLLDSANRALKESELLLDLWLSDAALDGSAAAPLQHLVFTHFPPFADGVGVDRQFAHAIEAGDLVARLTSIDALGLVVGEPEDTGTDTLAGVKVFRVGSTGGAGVIKWTKFQFNQACIEACQETTGPCECLRDERVNVPF
jgi:hypothetical protein